MGAQAAKARIDLQMDVEENLPLLRADERRLRQVLLNILSNATKFTPEGGQGRLSAYSEDSRVLIQIGDSGIGMAPEDIPRAIERFCRIDNTTNRSFSGTGLGLPLSKGLVELHGGSLDIESDLGVATTVTVGFPRDRVVRQGPVR